MRKILVIITLAVTILLVFRKYDQNECNYLDNIYQDTSHVGDSGILKVKVVYHFLYKNKIDFIKNHKKNVDSLHITHRQFNEAFENKLYFIIDTIPLIHYYNNTLEGIYADYKYGNRIKYNNIISNYSLDNYFNVYIFDDGDKETELLGFSANTGNVFFGRSKSNNIFLSKYGFYKYNNASVLIHETGHWLGLTHVFEMTEYQKRKIGITNSMQMCVNYMNYNCSVHEFTQQQLNIMIHNLQNNKKYLLN